jgi:trehalose 6-phosphate phosphatase
MKAQTVAKPSFPSPAPEPIDIARIAILLDVDGTLLDVAATPQGVVVPASLLQTLATLYERTEGAVALVSGRLVENLDHLFMPLALPCIGGHGVEMRASARAPLHRRPAQLSPTVKNQVVEAAAADPRIIVEDKGASLAVHYRLAPGQALQMKSKIAAIIDRAHAQELEMLCGKAVIEIKPRTFNKGSAVRELMKIPPFAHRTPLFIGDDVTDESVFAILPEFGGLGFSVGREVGGVAGVFGGPQDVRDWLAGLADENG